MNFLRSHDIVYDCIHVIIIKMNNFKKGPSGSQSLKYFLCFGIQKNKLLILIEEIRHNTN